LSAQGSRPSTLQSTINDTKSFPAKFPPIPGDHQSVPTNFLQYRAPCRPLAAAIRPGSRIHQATGR
jgi:hypothetical protein